MKDILQFEILANIILLPIFFFFEISNKTWSYVNHNSVSFDISQSIES